MDEKGVVQGGGGGLGGRGACRSRIGVRHNGSRGIHEYSGRRELSNGSGNGGEGAV